MAAPKAQIVATMNRRDRILNSRLMLGNNNTNAKKLV
jgi:hypothetical protein